MTPATSAVSSARVAQRTLLSRAQGREPKGTAAFKNGSVVDPLIVKVL